MTDERLKEIRDRIKNSHLRWPGEVHLLLAEVERTRSAAAVGEALLAALAGVVALDPDDMLVLRRDRDGVWSSGVSVDATLHITDATIAFDAALLSVSPHREGETA